MISLEMVLFMGMVLTLCLNVVLLVLILYIYAVVRKEEGSVSYEIDPNDEYEKEVGKAPPNRIGWFH